MALICCCLSQRKSTLGSTSSFDTEHQHYTRAAFVSSFSSGHNSVVANSSLFDVHTPPAMSARMSLCPPSNSTTISNSYHITTVRCQVRSECIDEESNNESGILSDVNKPTEYVNQCNPLFNFASELKPMDNITKTNQDTINATNQKKFISIVTCLVERESILKHKKLFLKRDNIQTWPNGVCI